MKRQFTALGAGALLVLVGLYMVYVPVALMVLGVGLLAFALFFDFDGGADAADRQDGPPRRRG